MPSMTVQATAQAYWSAQYRKRRRQGIRVYELELPEVETIEALQRTGFLSSGIESHDDVRAALQRAVLLLIEE